MEEKIKKVEYDLKEANDRIKLLNYRIRKLGDNRKKETNMKNDIALEE